jgi:hypothetical protein
MNIILVVCNNEERVFPRFDHPSRLLIGDLQLNQWQ